MSTRFEKDGQLTTLHITGDWVVEAYMGGVFIILKAVDQQSSQVVAVPLSAGEAFTLAAALSALAKEAS